jgi:hypothetical protein
MKTEKDGGRGRWGLLRACSFPFLVIKNNTLVKRLTLLGEHFTVFMRNGMVSEA